MRPPNHPTPKLSKNVASVCDYTTKSLDSCDTTLWHAEPKLSCYVRSIYLLLLWQHKIITLLFPLLYIISCSMAYSDHTDSNHKLISKGDPSTKSSAYMSWLINGVPILQPTYISFSLLLRSSMKKQIRYIET